jgi:glutamate carboxypeptidase
LSSIDSSRKLKNMSAGVSMNQYTPYINLISKKQNFLNETLESWSLINSGSENIQGLENMLQKLMASFSVLEGKMEQITLKPRKKIDFRGMPIELPTGKALRIRKHQNAPMQIFLGGHMDTVFPSTSPFQKIEYMGNSTLQGPGVADMKGGLLIMLTALEALEQSPFAGKIGWEILINPDEEIGSSSSEPLFIEAAKRNTIGLIFEPSFSDGALVSTRKGSINFTIVARGEAAHAGRDFQKGRNALTAIARLAIEAEALTDLKKGITVNIGYMEGGGPVNIVPDLAICGFNLRTEKMDDLRCNIENLHKIVDNSNEKGEISLILHEEVVRPPKLLDEKNNQLFNALYNSAKNLGIDVQFRPSGGVCDGNILSAHGLPNIDTLGAIGGNIHTFKEYILLPSLVERASMTALFLMQLASKEIKFETTAKN